MFTSEGNSFCLADPQFLQSIARLASASSQTSALRSNKSSGGNNLALIYLSRCTRSVFEITPYRDVITGVKKIDTPVQTFIQADQQSGIGERGKSIWTSICAMCAWWRVWAAIFDEEQRQGVTPIPYCDVRDSPIARVCAARMTLFGEGIIRALFADPSLRHPAR